jgi:TRAP-type C4-dicarboxylate transport system permease small subunit
LDFAVARWLKWMFALLAPLLAAGFAWGAWEIVQDRLAGTGWDNIWLLAFILATLVGLALLFVFTLAWTLRARLALDHQGVVLRGLFGTRKLPWDRIEGYRWNDRQLFLYPADGRWPINLSHFENQGLLYAWLQQHARNLQTTELAQEVREIREDHALGWSDEEKAAQLGKLRRIARPINWTGYATAAVGGVNALFFDQRIVQLVCATMLILVPVALMLLAVQYRNQFRLDYKEGSLYPEGLTGILASSIALGLMSLLDPHTLLGEHFAQWTLPIAGASAGLWLTLEWKHVQAQRRTLFILLHVLMIFFLSGFWAGGSIYQINKHADVSEPAWGSTRVTRLRESRERTGTAYYAEVAPWSASPAGPVELSLSPETYNTLRVGASVDISVRRGALEIPWVDEVRPRRDPG